MSGPGLIDGYLAELSADLPARIVEELADGRRPHRRVPWQETEKLPERVVKLLEGLTSSTL